ncbi:MAG TPA: ATP-dependent helicase C-terminal domain-containing protein, partial [Stackebrandtia sp.]|uniref:ATP-dependent helicase C-terminal domain-containing protein n=1 Tax=Stackebrandtia sp. TaxID=2023065 RepID=UPI002D6662D0
ARALLDGAPAVGPRRAAEIVALLSRDAAPATDDLGAELRRLRSTHDRAWSTEVRRFQQSATAAEPPDARQAATSRGGPRLPDDLAAAYVVALAFPERLARLRSGARHEYLMAGGTAAQLGESSPLSNMEWLAIASADRQPGRASARVRLAAVGDAAIARETAATLLTHEREIAWRSNDVVAREVERLGAIVLTERPIRAAPEELNKALVDGLRSEGLRLLRFGRDADAVRQRLAFCRTTFGDPWPEVDDTNLIANAHQWLEPELSKARGRADLARINIASALRRLIPWQHATDFDRLAPERVPVPSGSKYRVDYSDPHAPALEAKLQEFFGATTTPSIANGRIPLVLRLLSPAGRPAAVTSDLESFWHNGYRHVRSDLRGRYPKHPWPEDPATAQPTRRTKRPPRS